MKKGFEQIEEAFSELEKEFTNEDKTTNQQKDKQTNTKRVYQDQNKKKSKKSVPEELERSARQRGRVENTSICQFTQSNRDSNKLQKN